MAYLIKRTSTAPASPLRVVVAQADGDEAGLSLGGSFMFSPAGEDGDQAQVSEHAAMVIMGDPGLAVHFECQPQLPGAAPAADGGGKRRARGAAEQPGQ